MKCSYCGNELEKGADFCPECGMILGLAEASDDKKNETVTEEPEFKVPEYTPNVFTAIDEEEEEPDAPAAELESDSKEETVPVTENIPEYVSEIPGYAPVEFEDVSSGEPEEESTDDKENESQKADVEEEEELVAPEYTPVPDVPEKQGLDIRVPEGNVVYPEYEDHKTSQSDNEVISPTEEEDEEIDSDDIYVEPSKKKNGVLAVFLVIAVICVIVGGVYAVKNIIPTMGGEKTTTEAQTGDISEEDTTDEKETTEAEEDTTEGEEDTTEAEWTESRPEEFIGENGKKIYKDNEGNYYYYDNDGTKLPYTEDSTSEEDTTEEEEEVTTAPTTTKPVTTTVPSTTKPSTTRPSTTKPSTTRPSTTKPSTTTDPFGINDVEVKKPSSVVSKTYIIYCTAEGVILRSGPSTSSERVLYLSKGADLTVYGKENGFYYVRSNRYGVYGWVSATYASDSRPEAETTKVYKNTVSPDKKYGEVKVKNTTNALNIRKGPGTDYDVVALIPKGYPVKVIGYKNGVSGWVYVTDTTYGYSGWVSSAYIK